MTLPMDSTTRIRRKPARQRTDRDALDDILATALLAHVAVVRDGAPVVLPFACAPDGDALLLHGSTGAGVLGRAGTGPVSVAVTHLDALVFDRSTFDSSMRYRSAVIFGEPEVLEGEEKGRALRVISDHLFCGRTDEVRASTGKEVAATQVLRLPLDRVSVKVSPGMVEPEPGDAWAGVVPMALVAGEPVAADDSVAELPGSVRRVLARHDGRPRWEG